MKQKIGIWLSPKDAKKIKELMEQLELVHGEDPYEEYWIKLWRQL